MARKTKPKVTQKKQASKKQATAAKIEGVSTVKQPGRRWLRMVSPRQSFGFEVLKTVRTHGRSFAGLLLVGWLAMMLVASLALQNSYADIGYVTEQAASNVPTSASRIGIETVMMSVSLVGGSVNSALTEAQQLYLWLIGLFITLTVVWLLRHRLAGDVVTMRDGLYNAGAPLVAVMLLALLGAVQLAPVALSVLTTTSLVESGVVSGGISTTATWLLLVLPSIALSLYWLSATLFALIIATIPGTYPGQARKLAKQAIAGRRVFVTVRTLQLAIGMALALCLGVLPFVALDRILHQTWSEWLVIGAFFGLMMLVLIYSTSYLYLLYRKVIDVRA